MTCDCHGGSGIIANNATGEVSVDQYHRYKVCPFLCLLLFYFYTFTILQFHGSCTKTEFITIGSKLINQISLSIIKFNRINLQLSSTSL